MDFPLVCVGHLGVGWGGGSTPWLLPTTRETPHGKRQTGWNMPTTPCMAAPHADFATLVRDTTKPGLWTMDWTVDWTMDWAFLYELSCSTWLERDL